MSATFAAVGTIIIVVTAPSIARILITRNSGLGKGMKIFVSQGELKAIAADKIDFFVIKATVAGLQPFHKPYISVVGS